MTRKTPIRHHVGMHTRKGKTVGSYWRGFGDKPHKTPKLSTGYLDPGFFTHADGGSGKLTPEAEKLSKLKEVVLSVKLPKGINTFEKEHDFMWENYHIDISDPDDEEGGDQLYYNYDLRSLMGHRLDDGVYLIYPEYYVPGYESYWNALVKNSEVQEDW